MDSVAAINTCTSWVVDAPLVPVSAVLTGRTGWQIKAQWWASGRAPLWHLTRQINTPRYTESKLPTGLRSASTYLFSLFTERVSLCSAENRAFARAGCVRARCVCADDGGALERCNTGRCRGKKATCVPIASQCNTSCYKLPLYGCLHNEAVAGSSTCLKTHTHNTGSVLCWTQHYAAWRTMEWFVLSHCSQ